MAAQQEQRVRDALTRERTIDITTIGRLSGQPRRVEIWFHNFDGRISITGSPDPRDWYANLLARPDFTFHLKESIAADLPARQDDDGVEGSGAATPARSTPCLVSVALTSTSLCSIALACSAISSGASDA